MIHFVCPACQTSFQVGNNLAGSTLVCSGCNRPVPVPRSAESAPPAVPVADPVRPVRPRRRTERHRGETILALGLVGIIVPPAAPVAWILGKSDLGKIINGEMSEQGRVMTFWGFILGMIFTIIWGVIFGAFYISYFSSMAKS